MSCAGSGDPCLICGTTTTIYARIDPALAVSFLHAQGPQMS